VCALISQTASDLDQFVAACKDRRAEDKRKNQREAVNASFHGRFLVVCSNYSPVQRLVRLSVSLLGAQHRYRTVTSPKRMTAPSASADRCATGSPPMNVPFLLARSLTVACPPSTTINA